ncbi:MAG: glycosyltransferase [Bacteroidales bacterium]|nr:glycosyltransferase [Bacteroidales bacterium]
MFWGIGVSASYKNKIGEDKKWDFIRYYFMRGADALLFYSSFPIERYMQHGFSKDVLFIANNTVEVNQTLISNRPKNSILFIGTLYREKGIYDLLNAYKLAYQKNTNLPVLNIIGGGTEYENISNWAKINSLDHKIFLRGIIYDDYVLETYFQSAICTISPSQAGLSVLKSMGYGVPFITRFDSITGGERLNIINNENGVIYRKNSELIDILCNLEKEKDNYRRMGENAANFYQKFRLPEHMVQGFLDVIKYVYHKKS